MIYLMVLLTIVIAFAFRARSFGLAPPSVQWAGVILLVAGILLREWSVMVLGRAFTLTVTTRQDQPLIQKGPYHIMRHPAYTGSLLTLVGVPLALGTWIGALVTMLIASMAYTYRVRVEESALLDHFGETYREYQQRTIGFPW